MVKQIYLPNRDQQRTPGTPKGGRLREYTVGLGRKGLLKIIRRWSDLLEGRPVQS